MFGVAKEPRVFTAQEQQEFEDILKKGVCRVATWWVEGTGVRCRFLLTNLSSSVKSPTSVSSQTPKGEKVPEAELQRVPKKDASFIRISEL